MKSTAITLVLLVALLVCLSFAQQVTLEQTSPEDGLCLGDVVIYSCFVEVSHQLVWRYTEGGTTVSNVFVFSDTVNSKKVLGPLELELTFAEPVSPSTGNIMSTATIENGLTAAEEGAVISCAGINDSPDVMISFAVPSVTNVSYCTSTINWSPPPCDANCTVSVDGQDIGTVPCGNRNLNTDDSNLRNKMVMIVATDAIGSSHNVSTVLTSEDCSGFVEMSTSMTVSSSSDDVISTDSTSMDSGTQAGEIAGIVFGVLFAIAVFIFAITAIVLIYVYRHRKKGGDTITMSGLPKQVMDDRYKSLIVDSSMVNMDHHERSITHCAIFPHGKCMYAATADSKVVVRICEIQIHCQVIVLRRTFDLDEIVNEMKYASPKIKALTSREVNKLLSLIWIQHQERLMLMLTYNIGVFVCEIQNRTVRVLYEPEGIGTGLWTWKTSSSMLCTTCNPSRSMVALSSTLNIESTPLLGELLLESIDGLIQKGLTPTCKFLCKEETAVLAMSFSPSGKKLVTGNVNGGIRIYTNVSDSSDSVYFEFKAHNGNVYDVQFGSVDEEKVYSLGEDKKFYLWATSTTSVPLKEIKFATPFHPPQLTATREVESGSSGSLPPAGANNLFRFCFAYKYILISSVDGKVVHKVDSDFNLTGVNLELPIGPISCLDCITETIDRAKETGWQYTTSILGSTDKSVKFVRLRYGYGDKQQPGPTNQHGGGSKAPGVLPAKEDHTRMAAENRMFDEMNDDKPNHPLACGSSPTDDNGQS